MAEEYKQPEEDKVEEQKEEPKVDQAIADKLTDIAVKRVKACIEFKQPRMKQIQEIEDMLAYKPQPALKGRLNVPFDGVIMNGTLDTLVSQIKGMPKVVFKDNKGSNLEGVKKTQAFFDEDTSDTKGKWGQKNRWSKRLCAISNIGIFEIHAESDPKYKSILNVIDHYDFIFDPSGGADIEEHLHVGRTNLFKTADDLKNPLYNSAQVKKMTESYTASDFKSNEDIYQNKINRLQTLGLILDNNNYVGESLYNLVELEMTYNSKRYYLLFDYKSGIWIRCELLEDIFESNLYSYQVWNATENPFTILAPGPLDMIKPVAEMIRINLNEILNNNRKRNWGMRAVDDRMFPDLSKLDWKQDGVVHAKIGLNQNISNGIYQFETPELSGAINLNSYLNNFVGINSGIGDQTKGQSSQDTLGVAKIDDLNLSKRMSLISESYAECLAGLALRWDWNQWEHLDDECAIKVLGKNGIELTKFSKQDSEPDYEISVIVKAEDLAKDKITQENRVNALSVITKNPTLVAQLNPRWTVKQILMTSGWEEEEVNIGLNKDDYSAEQVSKANKALELLMLGKEADDVPDATPLFLTIIHEYLIKNKKTITPEQAKAIEDYFMKQKVYAEINAISASMKNNPPVAPTNPTPEVPPTPSLPTPTNPPIA